MVLVETVPDLTTCRDQSVRRTLFTGNNPPGSRWIFYCYQHPPVRAVFDNKKAAYGQLREGADYGADR